MLKLSKLVRKRAIGGVQMLVTYCNHQWSSLNLKPLSSSHAQGALKTRQKAANTSGRFCVSWHQQVPLCKSCAHLLRYSGTQEMPQAIGAACEEQCLRYCCLIVSLEQRLVEQVAAAPRGAGLVIACAQLVIRKKYLLERLL